MAKTNRAAQFEKRRKALLKVVKQLESLEGMTEAFSTGTTEGSESEHQLLEITNRYHDVLGFLLKHVYIFEFDDGSQMINMKSLLK